MDPWVVEVLREGYRIPLVRSPRLSRDPPSRLTYSPGTPKGDALESEVEKLLSKGAIEPAPCTPGLYSRLFVVVNHDGTWRPIIDLSEFNKLVLRTRFRMETVQSVLSSVRKGDWMVSIDLKNAFLQVPLHPESRPLVRFMTRAGPFQFRVLPFGLSTSPQVFTRVMAPVSYILHGRGIRLRRYIDDWLVQADSLEDCI